MSFSSTMQFLRTGSSSGCGPIPRPLAGRAGGRGSARRRRVVEQAVPEPRGCTPKSCGPYRECREGRCVTPPPRDVPGYMGDVVGGPHYRYPPGRPRVPWFDTYDGAGEKPCAGLSAVDAIKFGYAGTVIKTRRGTVVTTGAGYSGMAGECASPEYLCDALRTMRSAYLTYRNAHWMVRGSNAYGLHLLFERLYNESKDSIDKLAEQVVGTYGSDGICEDALQAFDEPTQPLGKALRAATAVQEKIDAAYREMAAAGLLTPGWDDVLGALASENDNHLYLIQQASSPVAGARRRRPKRVSRPKTTRACCGWQYMGPTYGMVCVKPCSPTEKHGDLELPESYQGVGD